MNRFKLVSNLKPTGDQPQAIEKLVEGLNKEHHMQLEPSGLERARMVKDYT